MSFKKIYYTYNFSIKKLNLFNFKIKENKIFYIKTNLSNGI